MLGGMVLCIRGPRGFSLTLIYEGLFDKNADACRGFLFEPILIGERRHLSMKFFTSVEG